MKVPANLQRELTRNQNKWLRKNVTGERWVAASFSVTNNNRSCQPWLLNKYRMLKPTDEAGKFELVTVRRSKRVTKRKGKRSSQKAPRVTVSVTSTTSKNTFGRQSCDYLVQKAKRVYRAAKRAARIERESA